MPLTLPYNVQDQVVIIPFELRGCTNTIGVVEQINVSIYCTQDATGGAVIRGTSVKYLVRYWAEINNVCNPSERQCIVECKEFCEDELRPPNITPVP